MRGSIVKRASIDGLTYYEYKPSIIKPFYINMEPITLKRRIRLLIAYFTGYTVFYIAEKGEIVGYCLVQNGNDRRYPFATRDDIVVGPYFIKKEYRGKKLSISLLKYVLHGSGINFKYAYDYIHKNNFPSIRASQAVGFKYMCNACISKFTRQVTISENTGGGVSDF